MAGYWFVQPYRVGGEVEAEHPCADFKEVVAKIKTFRNTNTHPNTKLRAHVPAHATDDERRQIGELGVESTQDGGRRYRCLLNAAEGEPKLSAG